MPEDTTATPLAGDAASPQEGSGTPPAGEPNNEVISPEKHREIKNENQNLRRRLKALEDAEADRVAQAAEAARLKAIEEGNFESLLKTAESKALTLEAELKAERMNSLRARIAGEIGVPSEFVDRLRGETEAEIRADAESVKKYLAPPAAPEYQKNPLPGTRTDANKANETAALAGQNQFVRSSF